METVADLLMVMVEASTVVLWLWRILWALRLPEIPKGIKMQQSNKMEMVNKTKRSCPYPLGNIVLRVSKKKYSIDHKIVDPN